MQIFMKKKLYAIMLGGRTKACNIELHDVVFAVGSSLEKIYPMLLSKWFGTHKRLHIDSSVVLDVIDGYKISLRTEALDQTTQNKSLFFVNFGGYKPDYFGEVHDIGFYVGSTKKDIIRRAKEKLCVNLFQQHCDDNLMVGGLETTRNIDDIIKLGQVDGYYIHLEPTSEASNLQVESCYRRLDKPEIINNYKSMLERTECPDDSKPNSNKVIEIPESIKSENVTMQQMKESHADAIFKAGKNANIWSLLPHKPFKSVLDVKDWICTSLSDPTQIAFVIKNKHEQIIGSTRFLEIEPNNKKLEIGWTWLNPVYWGTQINLESKYLLLKYVFERLHYNRVQFRTDVRNIRSQKAIEKLGATKEGLLRSNRILPDESRRDSVFYSILVEEWSDYVKSRLENMLIGCHI